MKKRSIRDQSIFPREERDLPSARKPLSMNGRPIVPSGFFVTSGIAISVTPQSFTNSATSHP